YGAGPGHRPVVGSRISDADHNRRSFEFGGHAVPSTRVLFSSQHEQLSIGGEDLAQSVLKGATGFDAPADVIHPLFGDALHTLLARGHKGQGPSRVSFARGAMAGRLSTTGLADGKTTRKQILGELEPADQRKFTLAEPGGFRALGLWFHLD